MLCVEDLSGGYGGGTVLNGITFTVTAGSVHAIVGHNGAGKTTLLHTITGLHPPTTAGRLLLDGRDITTWPTHRRSRAGIALVPQGRRIFPNLTVAEHLAIAHHPRHEGWTPAQVLDLLPQLAARHRHRGSQLSGGEQQMLAIARALLTQPRLLLLDEPTEGLAPQLVHHTRQLIGDLATAGQTILLTAPHTDLPAAVADHLSVLATGHLTATYTNHALHDQPDLLTTALQPATTGRPAGDQPPAPALPTNRWAHLTTTSSDTETRP